MKIIEVNTEDRKQVNQFLELPFRFYPDVSPCVPPLEMDARLALGRRRHPFYRHSGTALLAVDTVVRIEFYDVH